MIQETTENDYAALIAGVAPEGLRLADGGIAPSAVLMMLSGVADEVRRDFAPVSWLILADGEVVGLCSIVKPPSGGVVEIGYGIAPTQRRRGHATRAIADIVCWARGRLDVTSLAAETSTDNEASQQVLSQNGFVEIGRRDDPEDGPLICWRCST